MRQPVLKLLITAASLLPLGIVAAPGTLSQSPLFLGTQTEPNIVFVIDDSGSMDWEIMTADADNGGRFTGTQPDGSSPAGSGSVTHRDSDDDGTAECLFSSGTFYGYFYSAEFGSNAYGDDANDCNTADDEGWRFRNSEFNPLYFDPNKVYTPWAGVDANGNAFADIDISNAPDNPYNPAEYIDLTQHNSNWAGGTARATSDRDGDGSPDGFRYYTWSDSDGDGLFDDGEQTAFLIKTADADTQQNFANWFSYYRSRMLVAKAAYGRVIAESEGVRIGLVTMNASAQRVSAASVSGSPNSGQKRTLLDALYSIQPNGGTPLRSVFYQTGKYLECDSSSLFGDCPALSEAVGGSCQQNFSVVMTDGFYNGSFSASGNADGDDNTAWDGGAYEDSYSNTLGDIAMHFYERDIQTGLPDLVPTQTGVDEAAHQHVVTYSVAFGVDGTLTAMPTDASAAFSWPNPSAGDAEKIDDLRHAAYNGRGLFLSAEEPDSLTTALSDAITDIAERSGSAAAVAFNTTSLQTDSVLYLSLFNSTRWSGQLLAYPLNSDGTLGSSADWDAADVLDSRNLGSSPRVVYTYDGSDGALFQWSALTAAQQADLKTNSSGGTDSDAIGQARLNYLLGDRSHEGTGYGFRMRNSRLGDIVHSAPVYVGTPETAWPDVAPFPTGVDSFSAFKASQSGRNGVIYVGANDGMLHGFAEANGTELLAYIPNSLFSSGSAEGLHYLTDPAYNHRYYVDLTPTVTDAVVNSSWKTVLVGGLRAGGRGLYALDVTDPSDFTNNAGQALDTVLWEFDNNDDADLGYTFSNLSIALMNNGQWAAVFGNGYNDTGSGEAKLFILFLDGGLDGSWSASDYITLSTGSGDTTDRNGLSTPALIDTDGDSVPDRVYAGDLNGNMWVFDVSSSDSTDWESAYRTGSTPQPLFTAASGQPVTTMPVVTRNNDVTTTVGNAPNLIVYFGTGQFLTGTDPTDTTTQSFYAVWDQGGANLDSSDLVAQTVTEASGLRTVSTNSVDYTIAGNPPKGCYLDLPSSGERMVSDPAVRGDFVYFNTLIPSSDTCSAGGSGWLMAIAQGSCANPNYAIFDTDGDGDIDSDDQVAAGEVIDAPPTSPRFLGDKQYTSTGDDYDPMNIRTIEALDDGRTGRLSWQELLQ